MPTEADAAAYAAGKAPCGPTAARTPSEPAPAPDAPAAVQAAANGNGRTAASYSKLRDGNWGIRSTTPVKEGETITVETKAGVRKTETVGRVLWTGSGVWLATIRIR
jgi:hypothetical protein